MDRTARPEIGRRFLGYTTYRFRIRYDRAVGNHPAEAGLLIDNDNPAFHAARGSDLISSRAGILRKVTFNRSSGSTPISMRAGRTRRTFSIISSLVRP